MNSSTNRQMSPSFSASPAPECRYFEDSSFSQELLTWNGKYLESEQACVELMRGYTEVSGISTKWGNTRRNALKKREFMTRLCEFGGRKRADTKHSNLRECPFRVTFSKCLDSTSIHEGKFKVTVSCVAHNHQFTRATLGTEHLSDSAIQHIAANPARLPLDLAADIRAAEGVIVTNRMVSQIRRALKPEESNEDLANVLKFFNENDFVFKLRRVGQSNGSVTEVAAVLFTKKSAQAAFQRFNEVLLIDTTYGTNSEKYPLVNFVGVDNHEMSFIAASAIIFDETSDSFEYVLAEFLKIMGSPKVPVIVADGDDALRAAVRSLLPDCQQLLCRWHLGLNLKKSLRLQKATIKRREEALAQFYNLAWMETEEKYQEAFLSFINAFPESVDYMKRIKNLEKHWAECFTKYLPKLQCDTSQRVESMHARIKRVLPEQLCFYQLAVAISETIDGQAAKRHLEDALSIQRNLVCLSPELGSLAGLIPIRLLGEIQDLYTFTSTTKIPVRKEENGTFTIMSETVSEHGCSCVRWRSRLKPCTHFMAVLRHLNMAMVPSMVLPRWHLAQNLTIFASPRAYESTEMLNSAIDDSFASTEVTDSAFESNNESANQLSVLSNYFDYCRKIVESGTDNLKNFFFNEHIPQLISKMELPAVDGPEYLFALKEKTTSKGRPRKTRKPRVQSRIKPLVELEEDDEKSKKLKKRTSR